MLDVTQASDGVVAQSQHAAASAQRQVAAALDNQTGAQTAAAETSAAVSEDTQSNGPTADSAPANDVQQQYADGSELVHKLAANLQMALKALSVLKGIDSSVFEHLQPADLGNLDLHTLCQTPSPTPSQ